MNQAGTARVMFVCSSGGHLAQLMSARSWWENIERIWVTFDTIDAKSQLCGEHVIWAYHPTTRNAANLLRNLVLAHRVIRSRRPDVVVTTGAGVAVPFFVIAALYRIPRVFVEVLDRIDTATLTGRLCRPLSTEFCVQLPEQLEVYPTARLIGPLL
ncbi:MAG: UDP-N-acetylglucosamine--LPS N-acetylglucosamine transferase [Ornithinimicrobium sp.]